MFCIGIAGRSGSGKTRLAAELLRLRPRAGLLAMDSYYRDLSGLAEADRRAVNYDSPAALEWDLLVEHLRSLQAGAAVDVPRYDFAAHARRPETSRLEHVDLLVLEGLFALFDRRVRATLDLAVFVDLGEAEGLRRRIERDTAGRGRTESFVREQWQRDVAPMYARHVLPTRARADMTLDGTARPVDSARAVLDEVARRARGPREG